MKLKMPKADDLNNIQIQVSNAIGYEKRLGIVGGPGTGKSIVGIMNVMGDIKNPSKEVAFLVYSNNLQRLISTVIKNEVGSYDEYKVKTMHSWLWSYIRDIFINTEKYKNFEPNDIPKAFKIEEDEYPYNYEKIMEELKSIPRNKKKIYDYIIIDEAHDMPVGAFDIIKEAAKKVYIMYDDNQKFTVNNNDEDIDYLDQSQIFEKLGIEESFYDFTENYRNTRQIERVAKLFLQNYHTNNITLKGITAHKDGDKPTIASYKKLHDLVSEIVSNYRKNPSQTIAVLLPKYMSSIGSLMPETRKMFVRNKDINDGENFYYYFGNKKHSSEVQPDKGIFLMTYGNCKGLEFDTVYLPELNHPDMAGYLGPREHNNAIYTAITRSRNGLFLGLRESGEENKITKIIHDNENVFGSVEIEEKQESSDLDDIDISEDELPF